MQLSMIYIVLCSHDDSRWGVSEKVLVCCRPYVCPCVAFLLLSYIYPADFVYWQNYTRVDPKNSGRKFSYIFLEMTRCPCIHNAKVWNLQQTHGLAVVLLICQSHDMLCCKPHALFLWLALFASAYKGKLKPNPFFSCVCTGDIKVIPPLSCQSMFN